MKRYYLLTAIALCGGPSVFAKGNDVHIKGKITNPLSDSVVLSYLEGRLEYKPVVLVKVLDKSGNFDFTFTPPEPVTNITVQNGEQATELLVEPGYDLTMTLDASDFDKSLHYEGKGKEAANFMAKHVLDMSMMQNIYNEFRPMYAQEPAEFTKSLNERLKKEQDFLTANKGGLPKSIVHYWENHYKYLGYGIALSYPRTHEMIKKQSYDIGEIPAESYAVADAVPIALDDRLVHISSYRNYADDIYPMKVHLIGAKDPARKQKLDSLAMLIEKNFPPATLEVYKAADIYRNVKYRTVAESEANLAAFKSKFPKSEYTAVVEKTIAKKKKLSAGQPAIDFDVVTPEGKRMKLSDYKGKVVFLDFWASWCGPCIAEMPHAKKVKEHFKDNKNVVFVYISIDDEEENWKKAMEKHGIEGAHGWQGSGWQGPVSTEYGVNSIPAYFLIDRKGNFALDNTPRPSQTESVIAEIEKLL